jgi:hypothetical protein
MSMKKQSKISALVLALALLSVSGLANAAFTQGMTKEQAADEVKAQLKDGKSLDEITAAAKTAGVPATELATALIQAGQNPTAVTTAVVKANPAEAAKITTAAIKAAPSVAQEISKAAVAAAPAQAGAIVTAAIAAAPSAAAGDTPNYSNMRLSQNQANTVIRLLVSNTVVPSGGGNKHTASPS